MPISLGERVFKPEEFARELRMAIAKLNTTQAEVAEQVGLTPALVNRVCAGRKGMNVETYVRLRDWIDKAMIV